MAFQTFIQIDFLTLSQLCEVRRTIQMKKLRFPKFMFQCDSENIFYKYRVKENWININNRCYEVKTDFYEVKTKLTISSEYEMNSKTVIQV